MADYTTLGLEKIARQARTKSSLIRCPRDGAVMRVCSCTARHGGCTEPQRFESVPRGRDWVVIDLDLECPACRRRAEQIELVEAGNVTTGPAPNR